MWLNSSTSLLLLLLGAQVYLQSLSCVWATWGLRLWYVTILPLLHLHLTAASTAVGDGVAAQVLGIATWVVYIAAQVPDITAWVFATTAWVLCITV